MGMLRFFRRRDPLPNGFRTASVRDFMRLPAHDGHFSERIACDWLIPIPLAAVHECSGFRALTLVCFRYVDSAMFRIGQPDMDAFEFEFQSDPLHHLRCDVLPRSRLLRFWSNRTHFVLGERLTDLTISIVPGPAPCGKAKQ